MGTNPTVKYEISQISQEVLNIIILIYITKMSKVFTYLTRLRHSVIFFTFFYYAVCAVLCSALHHCNDFNHLLYI